MLSFSVMSELVSKAEVKLLLIVILREQLVILIKGTVIRKPGVGLILKLGTVGDVVIKTGVLWGLDVMILGVESAHLLLVLLAISIFLLYLSVARVFLSMALLLLDNVLTFLFAVQSLLISMAEILFVLACLLVLATNKLLGIALLTSQMTTMTVVSAVVDRLCH